MRLAALPAAALLALAGALASPSAAHASVTDGQCSTATGVTLVVDYQELGGGRVVKCVEDVEPGTSALRLLRLAGMTSDGTIDDGPGFVCRINGRPGPNEALPLTADPNYREACTSTPPEEAFWGYWHATNGGSWTFSNWGAGNREVVPGGYEGFSFSLNHNRTSNPPPGLTPAHEVAHPEPEPPTEPTPPPTTAAPPPTTAPPPPATSAAPAPPAQQPPAPKPRATAPAPDNSPSPTPTMSPTPTPSPSATPTPTPTPTPSATPTPTPTPASPTPTPTLQPITTVTPAPPVPATQDGGAPIGTLVGVGAVAAISLGGGIVWWRRRDQ